MRQLTGPKRLKLLDANPVERRFMHVKEFFAAWPVTPMLYYNRLMTSDDLVTKLNDHPFKPFRIRMVNATLYDIREPWMLMVGPSSAVVATETQKTERGHEIALDWRTVSIHHMIEFSNLGESKKVKRRA